MGGGWLLQGKNNPLHYAAEKGHTEALQLLLTADGDPNAENKVSASLAAALCDAIVRCSADVCGGWLLQRKYTPLHEAATNGQSEAVQLLLTADSDPNAQNNVSASPAAAWCDGIVGC